MLAADPIVISSGLPPSRCDADPSDALAIEDWNGFRHDLALDVTLGLASASSRE